MQKSRKALADARKSIRKRIENKQWTYCSSFMSKTWFCSLAPLFFFFVFYLETLIHFGSSFYYCNWLKNSHLNAYSMHHANLEWLIFLTTTLITGTTLIKNDSSIPPLRLFRATRLFVREEHLPVKFAFFFKK